jgi:hypothetical protein
MQAREERRNSRPYPSDGVYRNLTGNSSKYQRSFEAARQGPDGHDSPCPSVFCPGN